MNTLESHFDKIYIINLPKDYFRKISIMHIFNDIEYTLIKGIDHKHPEWKPYLKDHPNSNPGIWGYNKVMISILEDAIKNNYQNIIVFEDDIIFHKNFIQLFNNIVLNLIKKPWSVILLGSSQDNWNFTVNTPFYHPNKTNGSFAMLYNRNIFKNLLKEAKKMIGTFDTNALNVIYKSYRNQCFVIYPNIVIADVSHSNIRPPKNIINEAIKHRWDLQNFNFNKGPYISLVFNIGSLNDLNLFLRIIDTFIKQDHKYYNIVIIYPQVNDPTFLQKLSKLRSNNIDLIQGEGENRIEDIITALQKDKFKDQFIYCLNNNIRFDLDHISKMLCHLFQNKCIIYPNKYSIHNKYIVADLGVIKYHIDEEDVNLVQQNDIFMFKRGSIGSEKIRFGEIYEFIL